MEASIKKEHLINQQVQVLDKGFVSLRDFMGSDASIVRSARVSYGQGTKTKKDDRGLIRYLVRNRHTSPLEFVQFVFHVKAPIFVLRQWMRHRTFSFNELSGRYSEMENECYVPELERMKEQSKSNKQGSGEKMLTEYAGKAIDTLCNGQEESFKQYEYLISTGLSRELSRINLPLSTYTEMYVSVDLHNLFHFLKLRLDYHAQEEIRVYAEAIMKLIEPVVPVAVEAFRDYILNSVVFSAREIELIRYYKDISVFRDISVEESGLSKGELEEFRRKLGFNQK